MKAAVRLSFGVIGAVLIISCAFESSVKFLPTTDPVWNAWLDKTLDADLVNRPLDELPRYAPFQGLTFLYVGVDANALITLQVEHVTRRQMLQMLAKRYGLEMRLATTAVTNQDGGTLAIVLSNNEHVRELKPLK